MAMSRFRLCAEDLTGSPAADRGAVQPPDKSCGKLGSCACLQCRRPASRTSDHPPGGAQSKYTLLRSLKRGVNKQPQAMPVRMLGVDDWSCRKGSTHGTIMVDLERHEVLAFLPDRSAESPASWLACRPTIGSCGGIDAVSTRRAPPSAHRTRARLLIGSTFYKIYGPRSNSSSIGLQADSSKSRPRRSWFSRNRSVSSTAMDSRR